MLQTLATPSAMKCVITEVLAVQFWSKIILIFEPHAHNIRSINKSDREYCCVCGEQHEAAGDPHHAQPGPAVGQHGAHHHQRAPGGVPLPPRLDPGRALLLPHVSREEDLARCSEGAVMSCHVMSCVMSSFVGPMEATWRRSPAGKRRTISRPSCSTSSTSGLVSMTLMKRVNS